MTKNRLEGFSDGVIAIIITILVLQLEAPQGTDLKALAPLLPVFLTYILSYIFLGIYWSNHHHLLQATKHVNGKILWANLHLLFWLSLIPFVTEWMGENHFESLPTALYGSVLLFAAIAYTILQTMIVHHHKGEDTALETAIGNDLKGKLSIVLYLIAIPMAFVFEWISDLIYVSVAAMWLVPDRRIEKLMKE